MNVPPFPQTDGLSTETKLYFDTLIQQMQQTVSNNGFQIPPNSTADIAKIAPEVGNGMMWYDTTTNHFKGKQNGVIVIFQTTPA